MIDIETYCGICGAHCCCDTDVEYGQRSVKLTIECPECTKRIEELEKQVEDFEYELHNVRE
jgi:hypothetical protein